MPHQPAASCPCVSDDPAVAKEALRKAAATDTLVDESHFRVTIRRCPLCGQHFLHIFCERVDWADGDDPQAWITAPITEGETHTLRATNIAADEDYLLRALPGTRRFLHRDAPKGSPETLVWLHDTLFIPAHD
ncbi:MAG: hypothetical protein ACREJO_11240 [Phycisphaerales bacterium]